MSIPKILFLSQSEDVSTLVDDIFKRSFEPLFLQKQGVANEQEELLHDIHAAVIDGYSELSIVRSLPHADAVLRRLPATTPRIYLLQDASPTMEPDRLDRTQTIVYLRGPVSPARLRLALHRLISRRDRKRRFILDPSLQIGTYFSVDRRGEAQTFFRELVEIGPEGMSFLWSREAPPLFPGDRLNQVSLLSRGEPFWTTEAEVRHLSTVTDDDGLTSVRVGVRFLGRGSITGQPRASRDAFEHAHLTDPLLVRTALREMRERGTSAVVEPEGLAESSRGTISALRRRDDSDVVHIELSEPPIPGAFSPLDIVNVHFVRDNAQLKFCTSVVLIDDSELVLRMPKRLERLWSRSNLRYTPEEDPLTIEIFPPLNPGKPIHREIVDLSPDGLSFKADAEKDLLLPGMRLRQVYLGIGDGPPVMTSAEVRHLGSEPDHLGRVSCGLQFLNMDRLTQHQLVDYLINKSFPQVEDAGETEQDTLWRFLLNTNYLSPQKLTTQLFDEAEVHKTHGLLLHTPKHLSRTLVFRSGSRISGTVSISRIFSQTWMVHHLAASLKVSAMVPKNLMLYLGEYISKTPDIEYVRMMWRPANNWSNRMLGRLIHRLHNHDQSVVKLYNYLDCPIRQRVDPGDDQGWSIRPMEKGEELELEIHFIRNQEYFLMKAEDLHRHDPYLNDLNHQYGMSQLHRRREIFVAHRRGIIGGFCLMETGSPAFNLSNLLHGCRVLITEEGRPEGKVIARQLIANAVHRYGELGHSKAVALVEDEDMQPFIGMGFTRRKEYISWTFGQDIASFYNLYCHYIFRVYERLERRLRARSKRLERLALEQQSRAGA